ncbi:MAG TPA: hypothetical protein VH253_17410 [Phycisphaerae bacterium]|nr:hypothetical protein [Phycisphaerae bacterium]
MPPAFDDIFVDLAKLRDYCLSDLHPRGKHKARVFRALLGFTSADAQIRQHALLHAARQPDAQFVPSHADQYGQRFLLDVPLTTPAGTATVRSTWIVLTGELVLRLTSCYIL